MRGAPFLLLLAGLGLMFYGLVIVEKKSLLESIFTAQFLVPRSWIARIGNLTILFSALWLIWLRIRGGLPG